MRPSEILFEEDSYTIFMVRTPPALLSQLDGQVKLDHRLI